MASFILPATPSLFAQEVEIPVPQFEGEQSTASDAGHIKLVWLPGAGFQQSEYMRFELQQARDPAFETARTIYSGPDLASFISGLPNGTYYFRVRALTENNRAGKWSRPATVNVEHQSLKLAFTLFTLGAIVFLATAAMIIVGTRESNKES